MTTDILALQAKIAQFSRDRDWDQFHTPRSLILSLVSELGELAEVFQWQIDSELLNKDTIERLRYKYEEEIADVGIYLIRLCQILEVDLLDAIERKLVSNEQKYPVSDSKGNAIKYSDR